MQSTLLSGLPGSMSLLDLSGDLLRSTAHWLPPRDRFNLALASKRLYRETWGDFAEEDLTSRFPFESRFEFDLQVKFESARFNHLQSASPEDEPACENDGNDSLRLVPERSRMQHIYIDVSKSGNLVAVLAYDNILRIVDSRAKRILAEKDIGCVCGFDVWNTDTGKRVPKPELQSHMSSYEEENGLDVEVGFGFCSNGNQVFISSKYFLKLFEFDQVEGSIQETLSLDIQVASRKLGKDGCVGGSCSVSSSSRMAAWVLFADSPATTYISTWNLAASQCISVYEVTEIHPRRWSALGWSRVQISPNQRYLISIVNNAKKMVQTVRVGDTFRRVKRSEYIFSVFDLGSSPSQAKSLQPVRRSTAWLELEPDVYPKEMLSYLSSVLEGFELTDTPSDENSLTLLQEMRHPGLGINAIHSCPSEATYKSLSFGPRTRHPWFITKQPMYSLHLGRRGDRAIVSTAPHGNEIYPMALDTEEQPDGSSPRHRMSAQTHTNDEQSQYAFKGMPWRLGFASASAFSVTGKWLAGASLVGDKCIICVRNITHKQFYIRQS